MAPKPADAKSDLLHKLILAQEESNRKLGNDLKQYQTTLQTELVLKIEDLSRRITTLESVATAKVRPRTERKTAPKAAAGAKGAAPVKVPVTWTQYVSWKFETDDAYFNKMMAEKKYKDVADKVPGLDKLKTEEAKRKKQGTAVANWIKKEEEDVMEAIKTEHKEYKAAATKPEPPVQQQTDADSDNEEAEEAANGKEEAD